MALNRKQFRQHIIDTYGLPPEYPEWVNSRWINVHIDRGQREVSELTECIQGTCNFSAAANTRTYALTTDFVRVRSITADSNRTLEANTKDRIEAVNGVNWRGATGALAQWYVEDQRNVGFYPMAATAGSSLYVYGPRYAADLSADTSTSEIATALQDLVVDYVCREMAMLDPTEAGDKRHARFEQRYGRGLEKYRRVRPMVVGMKLEAPRG